MNISAIVKLSPRSYVMVSLVAAVGLSAGYRLILLDEVDEARKNASAVGVRVQALEQEREALRQACTGLCTTVTALSNQLGRAESSLAAERETHEPLRRQIESMLGREIALQADVEKAGETMQQAQNTLARLQTEVASMTAERQKVDAVMAELQARSAEAQAQAQARLEALDAEKQQTAARLADSEKLRRETDEALAQLKAKFEGTERERVELARQLDEAKSRQIEFESNLGAASQQTVKLQVELEALRKELEALKLQPAPPAAP